MVVENNKLPANMFYPCEYCSVASDGVCDSCDYKVVLKKIAAMGGWEENNSASIMLDNYLYRSCNR